MNSARKHTRLPLDIDAEIETRDGNIYKGRTNSISFGGMFVVIDPVPDLHVKENCRCILHLGFGEHTESIKLECRVIHIQENGIGFQFRTIDFEDYHTFKRMMVLNSKDPDRLLAELRKHPGLIVENSEVHHE